MRTAWPDPVRVVPGRPARLWAWTLPAGLAAGIVSWIAGEVAHNAFAPVAEARRIMAGTQLIASPAAMAAAGAKNAALAFGLLGVATGVAMSAAGALVGRSRRATVVAALSGATLGGVVGSSAAWVAATAFYRVYDPVEDRLALSLLMQAGIGVAVGAAGGLALAWGLARPGLAVRAALGGALGAALGQAIYVVLGTLTFPLDRTALPLAATPAPRLVARLLLATLTAAGATAAAGGPRVPRTSGP